ncbi:hypothetical protein V8C86DRAFT_2712924 [Haematococcus lacustris]
MVLVVRIVASLVSLCGLLILGCGELLAALADILARRASQCDCHTAELYKMAVPQDDWLLMTALLDSLIMTAAQVPAESANSSPCLLTPCASSPSCLHSCKLSVSSSEASPPAAKMCGMLPCAALLQSGEVHLSVGYGACQLPCRQTIHPSAS